MGGAMDLVAGTPRVVVLTECLAKDGSPKIVERCTLPLTGVGVVGRVISDHAVFDISAGGLTLERLAPGTTLDQLADMIGAPFKF
jgi:3-oxoacid CoA-transferase subunit B